MSETEATEVRREAATAAWIVALAAPEVDAPIAAAPGGLRGRDEAEVCGTTLHDVLGDDARDALERVLAAAQDGRPADARARTSDGAFVLVADADAPTTLRVLDGASYRDRLGHVADVHGLHDLATEHELAIVLQVDDTASLVGVFASPGAASLLGRMPEEVVIDGVRGLIHPDDTDAIEHALLRCAARGAHATTFHARVRHVDGWWRPVLVRVAHLHDLPPRVVLHLRPDVRGNRRPTGHALWLAAAPKVPDAVEILDREGAVLLASDGVTATFGGRTPPDRAALLDLAHPADKRRLSHALDQAWSRRGGTASVAWRAAMPDGQWRFVETRVAGRLHDPAVQGVILTTRDVTWRELFDVHTGLPGQGLLLERAEAALREASGTLTAIAVFDIDRFTSVNDDLGQEGADRVLAAVAERLADGVRPSDSAARVGMDRFAVLLCHLAVDDDALAAAARLRRLVEAPLPLDDGHVAITVTVGVAVSSPEVHTAEALLSGARGAVRRGKQRGGARVELRAGPGDDVSSRAPQLHAELLHALDHDELRVYYQPLVELPTRRVFGYEALLRWHHPVRGTVSPAEFIPVAEKTGLIERIGAWVLHEACETTARWTRPGQARPRINVNLSARQLRGDDILHVVRSALSASGLAPDQLCLELTETALLEDDGHTADLLAALRGTGVRLAHDDIGSGYSSLSHLRRYRLDTMKIDRSFVALLGTDQDASAIVPSMLHLAGALGLDVVAEGIETSEQCTLLRRLGCRYGQGYLFASALPAHHIEELYSGGTSLAFTATPADPRATVPPRAWT